MKTGEVCTVELAPFARMSDAAPPMEASLNSRNGSVVANPGARLTYDLVGSFLHRPERYLAVVAGALGGLAAGLLRRMRSSEVAAYRLSGTSAPDYARLVLFEELNIAGVYAAAGTLAAGVLGLRASEFASATAWLVDGSLAWMVASGLMLIPILVPDPIKLAKDR